MTSNEFRILAKGMKAVYASQNFLPDADSINVWYSLLKDLEYNVASAAIQKYMTTNKFPPTIADIRELAATITQGEKPEWSDGWEQVLRMIRKYGSYNQAAALEEMDDLTRTTVERLGYINLCMSENISVDRANFRMIFESLAERKQKSAQIPAALSNAINGLLENKRLLE